MPAASKPPDKIPATLATLSAVLLPSILCASISCIPSNKPMPTDNPVEAIPNLPIELTLSPIEIPLLTFSLKNAEVSLNKFVSFLTP